MNDASLIDDLLTSARTIAVVGYSERPDRPSNSVSRYLRAHGYRVVPVNPHLRGPVVEGGHAYDRVAETPADVKVDLVDVFRRGEFLDAGVDDAITAGSQAIWVPLGLGHEEGARRAGTAGMRGGGGRCTALEHRRLERERRVRAGATQRERARRGS